MAEPDNYELRSFEDVVTDFLQRWETKLEKEEEWFGKRPATLRDAIERAALSQIPSGRGGRIIRHSHQTRLDQAVLAEANSHLLARSAAIEACKDFDQLFDLIERTILPIPGAGEMLVYDIAQRLGVFRQFAPNNVYMHRGTRLGADALGLDGRRKFIALSEFPEALASLGSYRLEDVLCIYRLALARINGGEAGARPRSRC